MAPNPVPGSKMTIIPRHVVDRVSGLFGTTSTGRQSFTGDMATGAQALMQGWFGPSAPMEPVAPPGDVAGRAMDYISGYNIVVAPRSNEIATFDQLYALADNCNQVRLAIETVKDQMSGLTWSIRPKMRASDDLRNPPDDRCKEVEDFFAKPDGRHTWDAWMRMVVDQHLVIDAPSVYVRRRMDGKPASLDIVDGATIRPLLDLQGRTPMPPMPAYGQILKGMPAIYYTQKELLYFPRNPRVQKVYGFSPVEQLIMTINIIMRRDVQKLAYFTEGNIPEALVSVPETWSPDQIERFQKIFDALMGSQLSRSRLTFVPGGMEVQQTRSDETMFGPMDEWFARVVCYCFSLPPLPFVKQETRATAQSADEAAMQAGMLPKMVWFKGVMDQLVELGWGYDDLEFVYDDEDDVEPKEQAEMDIALAKVGVLSIDEIRAKMGKTPIGMGPAIFGIGPAGIMFVDDLLKAKAQGLTMIQPPPPPVPPGGQPMMGDPNAGVDPGSAPMGYGDPSGGYGDPSAYLGDAPPQVGSGDDGSSMHPIAADALSEIPPHLLDAVGLGSGGRKARRVDVTSRDAHDSDPRRNAAADPKVLALLRQVEAQHGVAKP